MFLIYQSGEERMRTMKDFSWKYFCTTGQIDAYLLYKDFVSSNNQEIEMEDNADYINE